MNKDDIKNNEFSLPVEAEVCTRPCLAQRKREKKEFKNFALVFRPKSIGGDALSCATMSVSDHLSDDLQLIACSRCG